MAGCGSKSKDDGPDGKSASDIEPGPERRINSDALTLTQADEDGTLLWVVRGVSSVTTTQERGTTRSELDGVDGEIYEVGVIVSRFKSTRAFANDKDKSIELRGMVTITSERDKATLTADLVAWNEARKLYDARGRVKIKAATYEAQAERLLADADLKKIGTPDSFK